MIFIGDVHGNWEAIKKFCSLTNDEPIIQVGDLNIGLGHPDQPEQLPDNFYFIRGNHDNPFACRAYSNYLGDYGYNEKLKLFYISGADSMDQGTRFENIDWWKEEQLSTDQLVEAFKLYAKIKPKIVVTHTCPSFIMGLMIRKKDPHRTEKMFDKMWNLHQPDVWIFGHFHPSILWDFPIQKTRFVCVPIDEYFYLKT